MLTEDKFMALAKDKYARINALNDHPNMIDYERGLRELMDELARGVINEQLGGQTDNRRKKKPLFPPSVK
ncbi:MAG: hypothetical protein ACI8Q1_001462 [Parvicella sp.]|jgi:hypothetical protein